MTASSMAGKPPSGAPWCHPYIVHFCTGHRNAPSFQGARQSMFNPQGRLPHFCYFYKSEILLPSGRTVSANYHSVELPAFVIKAGVTSC